MGTSTSPRVADQDVGGRPFKITSRQLWSAIWIGYAVSLAVTAVDYVTLFMGAGWIWCVTTGGVLLGAGLVAVFMDVASVRRVRGMRRRDGVAQAAAGVVVALWAIGLVRVLVDDCFARECAAVPVAIGLLVVFPVVPLGALTLIGHLVRRALRD